MNKEIYEAPEMEIVTFEMADVITTSNGCTDSNVPDMGDYPWPGTCRTSLFMYQDLYCGADSTVAGN